MQPPFLQTVAIQALAVFTALVLGGLLILVTGGDPLLAYGGLWEGSFGRVASVSETLVWATPYIFAGLAVALAFKAGLFNIGAEGQLSVGALAAAWVGFAVKGVPWPLHLLLTILAGCLPVRSGRPSPGRSRRAPARTKSSRRSCSTTSRSGSTST